MTEILHDRIPTDMTEPRALPGVRPLAPDEWLRVDEAYADQMAHKRALIRDRLPQVHRMDPSAEPAAREVLEEALNLLPDMGYSRVGDVVRCPDGVQIDLNMGPPLVVLGHMMQADICLLEKRGDEHVLTGAILCFPASWDLGEKFLRPLVRIHRSVELYDGDVARRVQRLFDGVRVGSPLWRFNMLHYVDAELHQPRLEGAPRKHPPEATAPFTRAERQCIVRLPKTDAVVFSIHTYVARRSASDTSDQ